MKHHPPYKPLPPGWNRPVYTVSFYSCDDGIAIVTTAQFDRKYAAIEAARAFVRGHLEAERTLTYRGIDDGFQVCRGSIVIAQATFKQTKKAQPTCDCSNHERKVCNICQGVDPGVPVTLSLPQAKVTLRTKIGVQLRDRTARSIVPTDVDNLTVEEVEEAIKNIHRMQLIPDGPGVEPAIEFALRCQAEVAKIEERGWKLGLSLSSHAQTRTKSGGKWLLRAPRKVFQVFAAFYDRANPASKVLFHISDCKTKREALERISKCPAPSLKQLPLSGI